MKSLLIFSLLLFSGFTVAAEKKDKKKAVIETKEYSETKTLPDAFNRVKDVPCPKTAEEVMKKLEEKKKAEAKKGLGLSLQGGKEGCSIK